MPKPPIPGHPSDETMKAVCFTEFGKEPSVLSLKTIPKPPNPVSGQVLIKVHACAVNPIDKIRLGGGLATVTPEPYDTSVLGYDVSGVVEKTGEDVKDFKEGDEVYVRLNGMNYGAMSEYVLCGVPEVAKKPSNVSFSEAASIPLAGLTALQALRRGNVKEGSKVFIPGGAGGVGSLAIQIAKKMLKASHVCTTASPGKGTEICEEAGADRVIDYRSENFEEVLRGEDFDMCFDTMNQAPLMGGLLKEGGRIISISGPPSIEAIKEKNPNPGFVVGVFMFLSRNRKAEKAAKNAGGSWDYIFMSPSGKDLSEITKYVESGDIKAIIDTEAPSLDEYAVAVDKLWSGRAKGKCVIKVI